MCIFVLTIHVIICFPICYCLMFISELSINISFKIKFVISAEFQPAVFSKVFIGLTCAAALNGMLICSYVSHTLLY